MRREVWSIAVVTALVATACGAGGDGVDDATDDGGSTEDDTVVVAVGSEPDNLNPVFGDIFGTIYGDHWPMFSSLLAYDGDLELEPDLAAGMPEISADGTTVTVALRDDVSFHDGELLDAHDVVFTYESILDPDVATRTRDLLLDSLDTVVAVDEHTVRFELSRMDPAFADKLTVGIVPAHLLEGEDLNTTPFNAAPIGTGPFVLDERREGERLVLTANPDYHRGDVGIPRLVVTFVGDENARVSQLEGGAVDVDAAGLAPRVAERFEGDDRFQVVQIPGDLLTLTLPTHSPLLEDAEVRRAIGMAVDRDEIVAGVLGEAGRAVHGPLPPQHWAHDPEITVAHDPEAAATTLADQGWTPGEDGILERDGERFALDLVYGESDVVGDAALVIRDTLADLGVEVGLEALGHGDRMERIAIGAASLDTLGNAYDPDLDAATNYHSANAGDDPGTNPARVQDADVDAALAAARQTLDRDRRRAAYVDLQAAIEQQGSWHYLVQMDNRFVVSTRVQGVDPAVHEGHIHGFSRGLLWNVHDWSLTGG